MSVRKEMPTVYVFPFSSLLNGLSMGTQAILFSLILLKTESKVSVSLACINFYCLGNSNSLFSSKKDKGFSKNPVSPL